MSGNIAKKYFILSLILLLITAGLYSFGIYFIFSQNSKMGDLERGVLQEKTDAQAFIQAESTLKEISENKDKISGLFLSSSISDKADFINSLEQLATSTSTSLETTLGQETIPKEEKFQYFTLQGTARGSLSGVYKFMLLLEAYPKALEMTKIELEKIPTDPKQREQWRLSFALRVLEFK